MAHIVVLTHEFDSFMRRSHFWRPYRSYYLLFDLLNVLKRAGHKWSVASGPGRIRGDVCILHTDCTVVPDEYLALASDFPVSINFKTRDISKRLVSLASLSENDPWRGPVIIKSNLNAGGWPEEFHNRRARLAGRPLPHAEFSPLDSYMVLPSRDEVPEHIWNDPNMIVERFIAEVDEQGYALRTWVFMGERERCTRHVSFDPIVKASKIVSRTSIDVPDELRAERKRLGFDFGKFDFVMHDGKAILLDANRTPGTSPALREFLRAGAKNLAEGLDELIR